MALNGDKGRLTEEIIADELEYLKNRKEGDPPRELKYASGGDLMWIFFDNERDDSEPFLVHGYSYEEYSRLVREYMNQEDWRALADLMEEEYTTDFVAWAKRHKIREELLRGL